MTKFALEMQPHKNTLELHSNNLAHANTFPFYQKMYNSLTACLNVKLWACTSFLSFNALSALHIWTQTQTNILPHLPSTSSKPFWVNRLCLWYFQRRPCEFQWNWIWEHAYICSNVFIRFTHCLTTHSLANRTRLHAKQSRPKLRYRGVLN